MKKISILLIIFVAILFGSCAIPNEPKISNYQKLDIETHYQTVGYARDFHLTDDRTCRIPKDISKYGWRSVSVIRNNLSCVLNASSSAPDFLKPFTGKLIFRS